MQELFKGRIITLPGSRNNGISNENVCICKITWGIAERQCLNLNNIEAILVSRGPKVSREDSTTTL